jgi:protein-L-isoaspartate(D-aspartate) O-methyltransferase
MMTNTDLDYSIARKAMIDSQLRTSGINTESVLARMAVVPREDFVPADQRALAYMDRSVPLGEDRFLSSPVVHGMMLTEANPAESDKVLVVSNGSDYFAELIGPMVSKVQSISADEATSASKAKGPFSLIVVEGAIEALPASLSKRREEDGRIVTGIVERGVTRLAIGRKVAGEVTLRAVADIGIPVLTAFNQPKSWSFA